MGRLIIKLDDRYLEWSTVVDAPVTYGMTRAEMLSYLEEHYPNDDAEERLARTDTKGTSSFIHKSAQDVIKFNRAGPNETLLTREEIVEKYCPPKN